MLKLKETATQLIVEGPEAQLSQLVEDFKFHPPNYFYAVTYQQYLQSDGTEGWDGYLYPFRKINHGVAVLPRGRKDDLFRLAFEGGIERQHDPVVLVEFRVHQSVEVGA